MQLFKHEFFAPGTKTTIAPVAVVEGVAVSETATAPPKATGSRSVSGSCRQAGAAATKVRMGGRTAQVRTNAQVAADAAYAIPLIGPILGAVFSTVNTVAPLHCSTGNSCTVL